MRRLSEGFSGLIRKVVPESRLDAEKNKPTYRLRKEGGFSRIVDKNGNELSDAYHEVKIFSHTENGTTIAAYVGKMGSMERLLMAPKNEGEKFVESPAQFHSIEFDDSVGLPFVQTGALKAILNPFSGEVASKGYHEIYRKGGKIMGKLGTSEEEIDLSAFEKAKLGSGQRGLSEKKK
jgi:hypothetical protein